VPDATTSLPSTVYRSFGYIARRARERLTEYLHLANPAAWTKRCYRVEIPGGMHIVYRGRADHADMLTALFGASGCGEGGEPDRSRDVFVSELPAFGSLRIPSMVKTVVPLGRSTDDILASYGKSLRRSVSALRAEYRYERVTDPAVVDHLDQTMLRPYVEARHEAGGVQLPRDVVQHLALGPVGALYALKKGDEVVGCHLGHTYVRGGKRYWHVNRFGYPEAIFSDPKVWGDANSINLFLALDVAQEFGCEYCDYGDSLARPGDGLLEWKRRRKGFLGIDWMTSVFYVRPPRHHSAAFFWAMPLFSARGRKLTLNLGIPADKTDEEVAARWHQMGFGGLHRVDVYADRPLGEATVNLIRELYAEEYRKPVIRVIVRA
jgi:hypothetical protein